MWQGHAEIVRMLLENSANVNTRCSRDGETALHRAARANSVQTIDILIEGGATLTVRTAPSSCFSPDAVWLELALHRHHAVPNLALSSAPSAVPARHVPCMWVSSRLFTTPWLASCCSGRTCFRALPHQGVIVSAIFVTPSLVASPNHDGSFF